MKKLVLLFTAVLLISCEGPMGPEGPTGRTGAQGPAGEDGYGNSWFIKPITIQSSEWELIGDQGELKSYYFVDIPLPQLTETIYKEGTVVAYIETETGIKNGLPYVLHTGEKDGDKDKLWTQTYSFDFYPGGIGFYVSYSDFSTEYRPATETFHIVLMW